MFSSVFALSPYAAAKMIDSYTEKSIEKEVLDIDEDAFRDNRLSAMLYGYLKVPETEALLQEGKEPSNTSKPEKENKEDIARYIVENMEKDTLYILGPGTTVKGITDELDVDKTLLGVDSIYDKELVGKDLNEKGLIELIKKYKKVKIIVTPIGGNGFIFGRGSKQITPEILRSVGESNIIIVSTAGKISKLECLRVDTGDEEVDRMLRKFMKVITGSNEETITEVR
jgi:predicted polyphosphate/ATP-dependent NAD kinase